jgi:hypothetical protein
MKSPQVICFGGSAKKNKMSARHPRATTAQDARGAMQHPSVSRRAKQGALRLADEQAEQQELADALRLVKRYEAKLQRAEESKEKAGAVGAARKRRSELVFPVASTRKVARRKLKPLLKNLLYHFQCVLKRYLLMKRSRSQFSLICTEANFLALVGGYADVHRYSNGDLFANLSGRHTADVVATLGRILGQRNEWWSVRYYGRKAHRTRDVASIKIIPGHLQRGAIQFSWRTKKIYQVDRNGEQRSVSIQKMIVRIPRSCEPVKPAKPVVEAYKANKAKRKAERSAKRVKRARVAATQSL